MTIKDKITPELKNAFSVSIKKTEKSGNEHGFLICADRDGKLSASIKKCEGNACEIVQNIYPDSCPDKVQGDFHVHPHRLWIETQLGKKFTENDIKNMVFSDKKGTTATLQTPSHQDVLSTLLTKCAKITEGTVCIASDLDPDKIGCWTTKRGMTNLATCYYAKRDFAKDNTYLAPKMWIRPLFNKEIIDLKIIQ